MTTFFLLLSMYILIFITAYSISYHHRIRPRVSFINRNELIEILSKSPSFRDFIDRMSYEDLKARNMENREHVMLNYMNNTLFFTEQEKQRIHNLVNLIDTRTINTPLLHNIPWIFVKTNSSIEEGFPHTLSNLIFISNPMDISAEVLLHEKIHIFQRLYPDLTKKLIIDLWGFNVHSKFIDTFLARNNPDTDGIIYSRKGVVFYQKYTTSNPLSISESNHTVIHSSDQSIPYYVHQLEHPYEIMAIIVAKILYKQARQRDDKLSALEEMTIRWIDYFLVHGSLSLLYSPDS